MAFLASDDIIAVSCVFENAEPVFTDYGNPRNKNKTNTQPKRYTYKTTMQDLEKGDLVLAECGGSSNTFGFCVVKVVAINVEVDFDDKETNFRWLVSKLDLEQHRETLETEKKLISKIRGERFKSNRAKVRELLGLTELTSLPSFKKDGE